MNATECPREQEVLDAGASACWPDDLRRHADGCDICGDLAVVAALYRDQRAETWHDVRVPTPGQVWWRAAVRRRAEAAAVAAQPITIVQGLAGACAAGLGAALITLGWPSVQPRLGWPSDTLWREWQRLTDAAVSASATEPTLLSLALLLGASLIAAPLVLFFALSDD